MGSARTCQKAPHRSAAFTSPASRCSSCTPPPPTPRPLLTSPFLEKGRYQPGKSALRSHTRNLFQLFTLQASTNPHYPSSNSQARATIRIGVLKPGVHSRKTAACIPLLKKRSKRKTYHLPFLPKMLRLSLLFRLSSRLNTLNFRLIVRRT